MSDQNAQTTPATPAPEAKPAKVQLQKQNGVTRPGGGQTGKVWEIADQLSAAAGAPAPRKDVIAKGVEMGINPATLATQYGRWRRFHGLKKEVAAPAAAAPAAAAPAATDTKVEETPKA